MSILETYSTSEKWMSIPIDVIRQSSDEKQKIRDWYRPLTRFLEGDGISATREDQFYVTQSDLDSIENYIAQEIAAIKEVEYVFCVIEEDFLDISTLINHLDRKVREKIYEVELKLLKRFLDLSFDFHVIIRENRKVEELLPTTVKMIFRRNNA